MARSRDRASGRAEIARCLPSEEEGEDTIQPGSTERVEGEEERDDIASTRL